MLLCHHVYSAGMAEKREREREKRKKNVERNKSPVHLLNIDSNPFEIGFEMRRE